MPKRPKSQPETAADQPLSEFKYRPDRNLGDRTTMRDRSNAIAKALAEKTARAATFRTIIRSALTILGRRGDPTAPVPAKWLAKQIAAFCGEEHTESSVRTLSRHISGENGSAAWNELAKAALWIEAVLQKPDQFLGDFWKTNKNSISDIQESIFFRKISTNLNSGSSINFDDYGGREAENTDLINELIQEIQPLVDASRFSSIKNTYFRFDSGSGNNEREEKNSVYCLYRTIPNSEVIAKSILIISQRKRFGGEFFSFLHALPQDESDRSALKFSRGYVVVFSTVTYFVGLTRLGQGSDSKPLAIKLIAHGLDAYGDKIAAKYMSLGGDSKPISGDCFLLRLGMHDSKHRINIENLLQFRRIDKIDDLAADLALLQENPDCAQLSGDSGELAKRIWQGLGLKPAAKGRSRRGGRQG